MRLKISILFALISFAGFAQRDYIYGVVLDSTTSEPMIGVHIRNITAGLLTNTNVDGEFKIPIKPGDSLVLTYIGFKSVVFNSFDQHSDEVLKFYLSQETTELPEVIVNVFPEYWRFKQQVIDTQEMDSSYVVFGLDAIPLDAYPLGANEEKIQPPDYHAPALAIGFDLGGLTKKGKEKKKLEKLLAKREIERSAYRKFNREWVAQETNLSGDTLTDFIAYCKFTPEYLVESTLFDIHQRMMALLDDFNKDREKSDDNYSPGA